MRIGQQRPGTAGRPGGTPRQLLVESYRQAQAEAHMRTLPMRPMSARATYVPPSTPQYFQRTLPSVRMRTEMATLVYTNSPRWFTQDIAAENAAYAQLSGKQKKKVSTYENMRPTIPARREKFKNCPWAGDAGTEVIGGNKWKRADEYDANRDMTMVPLNQLSDYLRSFARPTTHLEGLKKVGCAITIQATMRRKLEMHRHRKRLEAMQPPAPAPVAPPIDRNAAARVIQRGMRRVQAEAAHAARKVRIGTVDEGSSNYERQQRKVHEASVRAAGILDGAHASDFSRAKADLYQSTIENQMRVRDEKTTLSSVDKLLASAKIARFQKDKMPAAGGAAGAVGRAAAMRAIRAAELPRAMPPPPPWALHM